MVDLGKLNARSRQGGRSTRFWLNGRLRLWIAAGYGIVYLLFSCSTPLSAIETRPIETKEVETKLVETRLAKALPGESPNAKASVPSVVSITVEPALPQLLGPDGMQSLLVTGVTADNREIDLTHTAEYQFDTTGIANVNTRGVLTPEADGSANLSITAGGVQTRVEVTVVDSHAPWQIDFASDIMPILSRLGCNSGACHGKAEGKNGFKLSVFGFDTLADYQAIVKSGRGRRVMVSAPDRSLLLRKALAHMPHGGGQLLEKGTLEHRTLRHWIAGGAALGEDQEPALERIEITPNQRALALNGRQQLQVTAHFANGTRRDVSTTARYESNRPPIAAVDETGMVTTLGVPGQAAVMVSYRDKVAVARIVVPQQLDSPLLRPEEHNFIDPLVWDKLTELGIQPSVGCNDADYLRRVYLDLIGTLPTPDEARRFLADERPDKRAALVDQLLQRPEYVNYWALRWADLLRIDRLALKAKGAYTFYQWLRASLTENKAYDQFAREIIMAQGHSDISGPVNLYRMLDTPETAASTLSQVFLGVRIECARCHHHPSDKWSQHDFYGMVGFFNGLRRNASEESMALSTGDMVEVKHPRSGETVVPHALDAAEFTADVITADGDARGALAEWMTSPENRWFSREIANRLWSHFFGRGLIEPIDDMRETNPPSNEPLLDALSQYVVDVDFDLQQLIRAITASAVYQRSSKPNASNRHDRDNFSHAALKTIQAEVLLDAISQATGRPEKFPLLPEGTRAIDLWDNRIDHYFLKVFGRPLRVTACECERVNEPSTAQVLHLLNAPEIHAKISHHRGRVRALVESDYPTGGIVEDLYLATYSRQPDQRERDVAVAYLDNSPAQRRNEAAEDLLWTLMNTTEFIFNH